MHQGVGALELVGLPAAAIVLRAMRNRGAASDRQAAVADARARRRPRARVVRAARLPRARCSPASTSRRCRCSRSTARCRKRSRPSASIRPTCGRSTGAGARSRATPASSRARPTPTVRAEFEGQLLALMRGTQALTAAARMSEICAGLGAGSSASAGARRSGSSPPAMFEAQRHGLLGFDVYTKRVASRLLRSSASLQRGDSDVSERLAQRPAVLLRAGGAGRPRRQRAAPGRGARGLRLRRAGADRLLAQRPRPLRPGDDRPRARSASPPPRRPGRRRPAARLHRLAGLSRAVRTRRRFAAAPVPVRRDVRRRAAGGRRSRPRPPQARAAAAAGDGGRDQPALPRGRARGRRLRRCPSTPTASSASPSGSARCARAPPGAARAVDGGAVPARLRPPDDGQRRPGAARVAARGREGDRPVLPQPGRPRGAARVPSQLSSMRGVLSVLGMDQASQALVRMRDEVDGLVADRGRSGARSRGRRASTGSPATCRRARLPDRHAERAAAAGQVAVRLRRRGRDAAPGDGAQRRAPTSARRCRAAIEPRLLEQAQMLAFSSVREDVPRRRKCRATSSACRTRRRPPTSRRSPPPC